jgi:hypothetical protein
VSHLVPYCIFQEFFEVKVVSGEPFVRTLENRDSVRHRETVVDATPRQRASLVKAQKVGYRWFGFDYKDDILEPSPEATWNAFHGVLHHSVEVSGSHLAIPL